MDVLFTHRSSIIMSCVYVNIQVDFYLLYIRYTDYSNLRA